MKDINIRITRESHAKLDQYKATMTALAPSERTHSAAILALLDAADALEHNRLAIDQLDGLVERYTAAHARGEMTDAELHERTTPLKVAISVLHGHTGGEVIAPEPQR